MSNIQPEKSALVATLSETLPVKNAVSKPRGRPRSELAAVAVLDAAYRLTATQGLKGATMQAIAFESGVSKMTIYRWWEGRLELLIDAYLRQATLMLPITSDLSADQAILEHALRYLDALKGDLGRVQLAVLGGCLMENGNSEEFVKRYLDIRRKLGVCVISRGQCSGCIASKRPAEALYDQIYGTIFYRFQFGLNGLDKDFVVDLISSSFSDRV